MLMKHTTMAIWSLLMILTGCVNHLGMILPETGAAGEAVTLLVHGG